jgi:hypothetical protein
MRTFDGHHARVPKARTSDKPDDADGTRRVARIGGGAREAMQFAKFFVRRVVDSGHTASFRTPGTNCGAPSLISTSILKTISGSGNLDAAIATWPPTPPTRSGDGPTCATDALNALHFTYPNAAKSAQSAQRRRATLSHNPDSPCIFPGPQRLLWAPMTTGSREYGDCCWTDMRTSDPAAAREYVARTMRRAELVRDDDDGCRASEGFLHRTLQWDDPRHANAVLDVHPLCSRWRRRDACVPDSARYD